MAGLSYMQRRTSGIYEFRKRLPTELAGQPAPAHMRVAYPDLVNLKTGCFKGEVVRSLGTSDYGEAKRRDLREARNALDTFDAAMRALRLGPANAPQAGMPTGPDLEAIEAEAIAELLARDDEERTEGDDRRRLQTPGERAQWPDLVPVPEAWAKGMGEDHHFAYGIEIEEMAGEYRSAYARHDPAIVRAETIIALRRHGIPFDPTSTTFHQVGMSVLKGTVKAYDAMLRRQEGEVVETPPAPVPKAQLGPKLSEAFELWQEGSSAAAGAHRPAPRSVLEAQSAVRWFIGFHGDMRLGAVTKGHAREYQRALARMPRKLPAHLRRLPLRKLLERDLSGGEPRGATTVNKSLNMLAAIISHAMREGSLDAVPGFANPFGKDVKLRVDKREEEGREPFQPSDLAAIFSSRVYTQEHRPKAGAGEAAFWFPLIGLFTGMRLEEMAGLWLEDLRQDEETGSWFFDVTQLGDRRQVKTASSIRKVPVHSELVRIGLLRYRQSLIDRGASPRDTLWPRIKSAEGRPQSASWSKWFGRELRGEIGITDRRKVFHSFRHTFKRSARDAGIPEEMHDAITGHTGGGGIGKTYGSGVSLKPLLEAMDRIPAPAAVAGLMWSKA
jgi:integrase